VGNWQYWVFNAKDAKDAKRKELAANEREERETGKARVVAADLRRKEQMRQSNSLISFLVRIKVMTIYVVVTYCC